MRQIAATLPLPGNSALSLQTGEKYDIFVIIVYYAAKWRNGMGQTQRYQAAVRGHESRRCHWNYSEKTSTTRRPPAGIRFVAFRLPQNSWGCLCGIHALISCPHPGTFFVVCKELFDEKEKNHRQ